jgi:hypothetical protein
MCGCRSAAFNFIGFQDIAAAPANVRDVDSLTAAGHFSERTLKEYQWDEFDLPGRLSLLADSRDGTRQSLRQHCQHRQDVRRIRPRRRRFASAA